MRATGLLDLDLAVDQVLGGWATVEVDGLIERDVDLGVA
jgi:hypothetical protein